MVRNKIKIVIAFVLIAIYGFAIKSLNNSPIHSEFNINHASSQESVISNFSKNLFCHTAPPESFVNNCNNLPTPNLKNQIVGLFAILNLKEQLIESAFSQHTHITRNILINHRKSDIIFPFHYFW